MAVIMTLGVLLFLFLIVVLFVVSNYNKLVKFRNSVQDQWAQIEVHLKRRADLIPNLVETVKGYASHEKETFEAVISARNKAVSSIEAGSKEAEMQANGELSQVLGRLFALSEAYPELKADSSFLKMQENLKETEDKIAYARQFYNDAVLKYKNKIEMFPSNIIAGIFNFKPEPFFEATEAERAVPDVKF